MDRFIVLLWRPEDQADSRRTREIAAGLQTRSQSWTVVMDAPGLRVLVRIQRGAEPVVTHMDGCEGVIVGAVFERGRESAGRSRSLPAADSVRIVRTAGESLIKDYWGNYVALWRDPATGAICILRDPCGGISCFMTRAQGIDVAFSCAEDIADIPGLSLSVDWRYLQTFILFNYFPSRFTGFTEIVELLPGERMVLYPGQEAAFSWAWNGPDIAADWKRQGFGDAREELRETTTACLTAWGATYRDIVIRLSGGLDSSIVLNLIRRTSNARITALHLIGGGADGRELEMARLAAAHAGVELIERLVDPGATDLRCMLEAPRLARPTKQILGLAADEAVSNVCDQVRADCVVAGHGGDTLFIQRSGARNMFADYLRLHGMGKDVWGAAYHTAMLLESSVWQVAGDAARTVLSGKAWKPFPFLDSPMWREDRVIRLDALAAIPPAYLSHPWFEDVKRLPTGKADHLAGIVALRTYQMMLGHGVTRDALLPLVSQPIVAFCLRTPTYVFGHGGVDRALERHAFADIIPRPIVQRTDKGAINSYLLQVTQRNLRFLRELILDGDLVKQDWIDRAAAERCLSPAYLAHGARMDEVYNLAVAEAWLRRWRVT